MVIMAIIKKSKWKGSKRLDDMLVTHVSNSEAQAEIDKLLATGFRYRFATRNYKTELIHKFINGVEYLVLVLWDA
jgi:hypothetical protein